MRDFANQNGWINMKIKEIFGQTRLGMFFAKLDDKKKQDLLVLLGVCGIMLLALPEILPKGSDVEPALDVENLSAYETQLEERLCALLSRMEGVGKCCVMLTLETGETAVYATTQRSSRMDSTGQQSSAQSSFENDYVIIDGSDGRQALVEHTQQPQVRGVVILCEGGADISCVKKVTEAAQALLGIPSNRICVNKLN